MDTKKKLTILVLIWAAVLVQLVITKGINREQQMIVSVMSEESSGITDAEVKVYALYGNEPLSENSRTKIVTQIAKKLGVTSDYDIRQLKTSHQENTTLEKTGANADTTIRLLSTSSVDASGQTIHEQYLMTQLTFKNQSSQAIYDYKTKIEQIYKDLGMETSTNLYLCSQEKGRMSEDEIESATNDFLSRMHARIVKEMDFENTHCLYGYTDTISEYVYQNDEKVNVNIAFSYDEEEDITYIHRAIPFIDRSF